MKRNETVFVGLSGGVDSSVAALRLIDEGYNVVGVFIKVWHPDFMVCNWEQERLDAMRVAAHLDIPFLTCDAEETYKTAVADYFIAEYQAGRTPNPDVMCNKEVKFGAFLEFAMSKGADYIATGHYAQKIDNTLCKGIDPTKDQSYFLWSLNNEQLEKSLFPIGNTPKTVIRAEATAAGIPTAIKKDSQGICFLGHVDIPSFLAHFIELVPGEVVSTSGEVIGRHQGALVYTIGQRHGFTLHNPDSSRVPLYVVEKDIARNVLIVGETPITRTTRTEILLENSILRDNFSEDKIYHAQFRYHGELIPVHIKTKENNLLVTPVEPVSAPASGQSCVLYDDTVCLGGGIVA